MSLRNVVLIVLALLLAMAVTAAAAETAPVVFTKSGMEEAALPWKFVDSPIKPVDTRRVRWHIGWVEIKTRFGVFRLIFLPIAAPLEGSPGSRDWNEMPNPFV